MAVLKNDNPRGILNPKTGERKFNDFRYKPSDDLVDFIEHFWFVEWDLRKKKPYRTETLPHPCIHIVFERGKGTVIGITKGKFSRLIEGKGNVFGIKFKPGAFYPFVKIPISTFTNKTFDFIKIFGRGSQTFEKTICSLTDNEKAVDTAEQFLRARLPVKDENVVLIDKIVESIINDKTILKVDNIVELFNINKRVLQRLFSQYVGVSPKWMIKRYRLHEAAEQLAGNVDVNLSMLAVDLGYFDQAHFIKDFKSIVGKSPEQYVKDDLRNSGSSSA